MCKNSCNECQNKLFSSSVSVVTVDGTDTLVIDVENQTFRNNQRGCIVIIQNIPSTATIDMPVAISINGDTTTVYPLVTVNCRPVTVPAIRTRRRYPFKVLINTANGAVFRILKNLSCSPNNYPSVIPSTTTTDDIGG